MACSHKNAFPTEIRPFPSLAHGKSGGTPQPSSTTLSIPVATGNAWILRCLWGWRDYPQNCGLLPTDCTSPLKFVHFHHYSMANEEEHPNLLQQLCFYLLQSETSGYWDVNEVGEITNRLMACGQKNAFPTEIRPFPSLLHGKWRRTAQLSSLTLSMPVATGNTWILGCLWSWRGYQPSYGL